MKTRPFALSVTLVLLALLMSGVAGGGAAQASVLGNSWPAFPGPAPAAGPVLTSIAPDSFIGGVNVPLVITGENLETVLSARLGTTALRNLQVIDSSHVSALAPWSIAPGAYDLELIDQTGQSAHLADAVTVSAAAPGWTSNGPFGGDLWDIVLDPQNPARMFVSAQRSGLFKTETGGETWGMALVKPFPLRTQIAYPTPGQPPAIYLSGDGGLGLVRSRDYGQSWDQLVSGNFVGNAFVRSDHPGWVYLARRSSRAVDPDAGLYLSTDLGETWSHVPGTAGLHVSALAFDPAEADHKMVIGTQDGKVYTTADGGSSWSTPVAVADYIGRLVFSPTLYEGKRSLWAIGGDSNDGGSEALYRSIDGGATWQAPIRVQPGENAAAISYHATIPGLLWASVGGGYYSETDGATWTPDRGPEPGPGYRGRAGLGNPGRDDPVRGHPGRPVQERRRRRDLA